MKYLSDYMEGKQTEAFKKYGAFFAFSHEQVNNQRVRGITYINLGAGLIAPKDNADMLIDRLEEIHKESIAQDIEENGIGNIIYRELNNHECFYIGSYEDVIDVLKPYGITEDQIIDCWKGKL